jgi:uncharacterized membrane protein (DUF373 family)
MIGGTGFCGFFASCPEAGDGPSADSWFLRSGADQANILSFAMDLFSDQRFLRVTHSYERPLAKILALMLAVVIGFATFALLLQSGAKVVQWQIARFDGSLIKLLDRLLLVFIALEVLQNVMAYLRDQVVQIELVLLTALTAVARKLIVVGLAAAYWLVRKAGQDRGSSTLSPTKELRPT